MRQREREREEREFKFLVNEEREDVESPWVEVEVTGPNASSLLAGVQGRRGLQGGGTVASSPVCLDWIRQQKHNCGVCRGASGRERK